MKTDIKKAQNILKDHQFTIGFIIGFILFLIIQLQSEMLLENWLWLVVIIVIIYVGMMVCLPEIAQYSMGFAGFLTGIIIVLFIMTFLNIVLSHNYIRMR